MMLWSCEVLLGKNMTSEPTVSVVEDYSTVSCQLHDCVFHDPESPITEST